MKRADRRFYLRWIAANAVAEGIGLGATLLIAYTLIVPMEGASPGPGTIVLGAVLAIAMGTVLEGALVGFAQGQVLCSRTPRLPLGLWTLATAIGAGIAWLLGVLPSTIIALLGEPSAAAATSAPPFDPPPWLTLLLALALGAVLGPVLGYAQWRVLRRTSTRAWRWLAANALAWAIGMAAIFAAMDLLDWNAGMARIALGIGLACTAAGALVGAVHGWVLVHMLSESESPQAQGTLHERLPAV